MHKARARIQHAKLRYTYHTCSASASSEFSAQSYSRVTLIYAMKFKTVHLYYCSSEHHRSHIELNFQTKISAVSVKTTCRSRRARRTRDLALVSTWHDPQRTLVQPLSYPVFWLVPWAVSARSGSPGLTTFILHTVTSCFPPEVLRCHAWAWAKTHKEIAQRDLAKSRSTGQYGMLRLSLLTCSPVRFDNNTGCDQTRSCCAWCCGPGAE